jgi:hypothetical protein
MSKQGCKRNERMLQTTVFSTMVLKDNSRVLKREPPLYLQPPQNLFKEYHNNISLPYRPLPFFVKPPLLPLTAKPVGSCQWIM